jgi:hypothetical protein
LTIHHAVSGTSFGSYDCEIFLQGRKIWHPHALRSLNRKIQMKNLPKSNSRGLDLHSDVSQSKRMPDEE